MKVFYKKDEHVIIKFSSHEMTQALAVLKALAQYFKAKFIFDVAQDLENDLSPSLVRPRIAYTLYHHVCESCYCEVDSRTDNAICKNGTWTHKVCPQLKQKLKGKDT